MCVCCEATCDSRTLFVKASRLLYGVTAENLRMLEEEEEEEEEEEKKKDPRVTLQKKKNSSSPLFSPLFFLCFYSYSAEFLQQVVLLILFCVPLLNLLPFECVLLENPANRI
jgi:hypothetical protein